MMLNLNYFIEHRKLGNKLLNEELGKQIKSLLAENKSNYLLPEASDVRNRLLKKPEKENV